jgi:outer membrane protein assembly factor BamB
MSGDAEAWLYSGRGASPTLRWSFTADAPLTDLCLARETGEMLVADVSGGLYLLDRRGRVVSLIRTRHAIQRVALADTGAGGTAAFDNRTIVWFDRKLQFDWTREVPDDILAIGMDPHGTHVAIAMADGVTTVLTSESRRASRFETVRPLRYLQLLTTATHLVAAAEHGLVGRYSMRGETIWTEKLWSNVGDLAVTGDGRSLFLAGFAHGVQSYDGAEGTSRGSFVTEGTVSHVACGYARKQLVAATLERHLFAMSDSGDLVWNLTLPEDLTRILMSPLGDWIVLGFASGRIVRLDCGR